eukprot:scaffold1170_cov122-Cylindrotheca_fusiformis.AAC.7
MEGPNIVVEEKNLKRKSSDIEKGGDEVDPSSDEFFFVFTSETKKADIPEETLTHLRVDSSVTEIFERTFEDCNELVHVQLIPETLTRIGEFAFSECSSLKFVQFVSRSNSSSLDGSSSNGNLDDGTIEFPANVKLLQIDKSAFSSCHSLRKVIVGSNSTILGKAVFCECLGLVSVVLPNGLQVIQEALFCGCESLTTVKIPSSVITICEDAFFGCRSLTSVELLDGLLEIGVSSFSGCDSIESLHIPSSVSSIQRCAFRDCVGLQYIKLPPTLERIECEMLCGCCGLGCIEIPPTVSFIGKDAFSECFSLSHVRLPGPISDGGVDETFFFYANAFTECNGLISIELPEESLFHMDIDGCHSLVNVACPILLPESRSWESFSQNSKLGIVATDEADLNCKLKHRFMHSPLNKLCYYQSYYSSSSSEEAMEQLRTSLMNDDPTTQVDTFGMTPLHILSLSQTPNLDMLFVVMDADKPGHMVRSRDSFGCTPMDYLCLNRMPNSTELIRRLFQTRFEQVLGLDRSWKSNILQSVEEALAVDWSSRRREIGRIVEKYERKEIFSLVELYLWKVKIDEATSKKEQILVVADRQTCRIKSGAALVIRHVLPFLHNIDVEDFSVGSQ